MAAVALRGFICLNHHRPGSRGRREADVYSGGVLLFYLNAFQLPKLFDLALHLYRLGGFVPEPLDKSLGIVDHLLLVAVGCSLLLASLAAKHGIFCIGDPVVVDFAEAYLYGTMGDIVEEGTVMRHQHHSPGVGFEESLEPYN